MAEVKEITITAGRKVSRNYCTRDYEITAVIGLGPDDHPKQVADTWTQRLQAQVDQALGDPGSPDSFAPRPPGG